MKYTPGPWTTYKPDGVTGAIRIDAGNTIIGWASHNDHKDSPKDAMEVRGNANLMAASPDIYEAACEVLEQWSKGNLSAAMQKLAKVVYKANPDLAGRE